MSDVLNMCSNLIGQYGGTTEYDHDTNLWTCTFGVREAQATATSPDFTDAVLKSYGQWWDTYFVFGSNLGGNHGAGAARHAFMNYGAEMGVGSGYTGRSYAIPTKYKNYKVIPLEEIIPSINAFIERTVKDQFRFILSRVGCGLAGYTDEQIAPLFEGIGKNVIISYRWAEWFPEHQTWIDP